MTAQPAWGLAGSQGSSAGGQAASERTMMVWEGTGGRVEGAGAQLVFLGAWAARSVPGCLGPA